VASTEDDGTASVLYRILTERKNVDQVKSLLGGYGVDYTIFYGDGAWRCIPENSMAIELANLPRALAESVSTTIKHMNGQSAILLQEIPTRNILL
jgi:hypothetical protein